MSSPFNPYAFPSQPLNAQGEPMHACHEGMGLRDYFAAKAMQVTLAQCNAAFPDEHWRIGVAMDAYAMADAMLKAREVQP